MPTISVVIPSYNRADTIKESVMSVLNQTYKDLECVIVDDGSTDDTKNVLSQIHDNRLHYYKLKENRGACYARNYGVTLAQGHYIAFHDSDDLWNVEKLEKQIDFMNRKNADMVFCRLKTAEMGG